MLISCFSPDNASVPPCSNIRKKLSAIKCSNGQVGCLPDGNSSNNGTLLQKRRSMMANATPPHPERSRPRGATGAPPIKKSTVEVRQGRSGRRVLIILAVSLALLAFAYFVLYFYYPRPTHQTMLSRPILAATTPVVTPTMAPPMISLSQ